MTSARGPASSGIAPGATILPVKITGGEDGGDEEQQRSANLAKGISYACPPVPTSSTSPCRRPRTVADIRAAVAAAVRAGVVVVASAGNREQAADAKDGLRYPAAYPGVIGVSATNAADVVTPNSIRGPQVDLAAPGDTVISTSRRLTRSGR